MRRAARSAAVSSAAQAISAPEASASWHLLESRSTPMTRHPLARHNWTRNCPSRPRPITATLMPSSRRACRRPCSAIAPTALELAASRLTFGGTGATRVRGTALYSACVATVSPMQATRSPTRNSSICEPTAGHDSGAAVAQSRRRSQTFLNLAHCGAETLLLERLYDLLNLVRPFAGLGGKVHSRLGHLHFLGAHADE